CALPISMGIAVMSLLAIPFPSWVAWRIGRLYSLDEGTVARTMLGSWGAGLILLILGAGARAADLGLAMGVLAGAGLVGVMLLYYRPVLIRNESEEMGFGQITRTTPDGGEQEVEVRFRPLLAWKDKKGTEFSLLALPLGGFAAIKGMHPKPDGSEVTVPQGFYSRPPWQRFIVLAAGPAFSIIFGCLLIAASLATWGRATIATTNVVEAVMADSAAAKAGIRPGDRVVSIEGQPTADLFDVVERLRDRVQDSSAGVTALRTQVTIQRDGVEQTLEILPTVSGSPEPVFSREGDVLGLRRQAKLGVAFTPEPNPVRTVLPWDQALAAGFYEPIRVINLLGSVLQRFDTARQAVGGPISMAQTATQAADAGIIGLVSLAASLSIVLGIMNLLPIPPLDGGQMVVAVVEMFRRGRRLSIQVQNVLSSIGLAFVILLTLAAVSIDLGRQADRQTAPTPIRLESDPADVE
ncbi:MAG: RIP metalloprotease, partial [Fimbriimonadaceae bacterium]|nr:RIP metalloprotease [Fimbriimonadaceae bacterium]